MQMPGGHSLSGSIGHIHLRKIRVSLLLYHNALLYGCHVEVAMHMQTPCGHVKVAVSDQSLYVWVHRTGSLYTFEKDKGKFIAIPQCISLWMQMPCGHVNVAVSTSMTSVHRPGSICHIHLRTIRVIVVLYHNAFRYGCHADIAMHKQTPKCKSCISTESIDMHMSRYKCV